MASVELPNFDDRLYQTLLTQAAKDHCSVGEEVEAILRRHLVGAERCSADPQEVKKANDAFLKLIGTWRDDRTAEEIVADIRASRRTDQRFNADHRVFD